MEQSSLTKKHMIAFLLILAIPLFMIILSNSLLFRREAIRIAQERTEEVTQLFAQSLNREAENYAFFASALVNDLTLQEHARIFTTTDNDLERYKASQGLQATVFWLFRFTTSIGSVFLFFEDDEYLQYSNDSSSALTEELARTLLLQSSQEKGEVYCLDTVKITNKGLPVITMVVQATKEIAARTNLEAILVSFQIDPLTKSGSPNDSPEFLVGREGTVLYSGDPSVIGQMFSSCIETYASDHLILSSEITSTGWTYYQIIPYASLTHGLGIIMRFVYLALIISLLLFLLYTRSFFSNIIRPLHSVIKRMDNVAQGDFSVQVQETGTAEFLHLERTFNSMVQRIKVLTDELLRNQQEQSRLELEALRYRLNPHFILNTLNSMTIMAGIAKAEALKNMSKAMTNIMRQTLKDDTALISYAHEREYLESYIYISSIRFGNRFSFSMHVDEKLDAYCLPTMLLQPLVENAILHGMRGKQGYGSIVVNARYQQDHAVLTVEDNGVGMRKEVLDTLFVVKREGKHGFNQIGLDAVKRRVNLAYPGIGELTVTSIAGEGTKVTIILPLIVLEHMYD
ncbi:histidine kinase [Sphaerochaeta sp.]|jgi:two-component system sensor histidine kinase YesM|uniref:cache domain-containing sensor histidine kinase n=2 Tax=Sphaerochaeta sp. TaxID=1972642 RepID=UPI00258A3C74|nr:histidine kinase [Sphaerochaeta sp.]MDD3457311.1 histidine kinase [Sphaerochaeta sp.]